MTKRSKAYRAAAEKIQSGVLYTPAEAVHLAKSTSITKFDATVDVVFRLGVDPRKADQMVRGTVSLPHGTGKTARVVVFAQGERAEQALAAGADEVGGDELIEKVAKGYTDFDAAVATPDLMGKVGRLGRVLGPRGLMPNPRTGTVTMDVAKAVSDIKGGRIEFRVDRASNLHFIIGKASFTEEQLTENFQAALEEVLRLKPSTSKGRYILKATMTTTMGPGIPMDVPPAGASFPPRGRRPPPPPGGARRRSSPAGACQSPGPAWGQHEPSTGASAHGPRRAALATVKALVVHRMGEGSGEAGCPRPCLSLSQGRGRPLRLVRVPDRPQLFLTGMSVRRKAKSATSFHAAWSRVTVSPPGSGQMTQTVVVPALIVGTSSSSVRGTWVLKPASR